MNKRKKQDVNQENGITDLEPKDDVTGGNSTWTGSITLGSTATIGAAQGHRESTLIYSGESGGMND
jgi:hypothetical protein